MVKSNYFGLAGTLYTSTVSVFIIATTVTPTGLSVNSKNKKMATF